MDLAQTLFTLLQSLVSSLDGLSEVLLLSQVTSLLRLELIDYSLLVGQVVPHRLVLLHNVLMPLNLDSVAVCSFLLSFNLLSITPSLLLLLEALPLVRLNLSAHFVQLTPGMLSSLGKVILMSQLEFRELDLLLVLLLE